MARDAIIAGIGAFVIVDTEDGPRPERVHPRNLLVDDAGCIDVEPPELVIQGDPLMKLLPRDAIASVDDPVMVPAAAGDSFMRDEEMVLGVFTGGQARAYSTWHLDRHEIVNDRLGETPIAATW
jgi:hypothetical protein